MPTRPRIVIIDGIHYVAMDTENTTGLRLSLWQVKAKRAQARLDRLREVIRKHIEEIRALECGCRGCVDSKLSELNEQLQQA